MSRSMRDKQAQKNFAVVYWHVEDVMDAAPHLTEDAARAVLHQLAERHEPRLACITPETVENVLKIGGHSMAACIYGGFFFLVWVCASIIYWDVTRNQEKIKIKTIVNVKGHWLYDEVQIVPAFIRRGEDK